MLAIIFQFPLMLAACGAAAAPVIIHLILRTKPRRVTFPPLAFVLKTQQASVSTQRLKHLLLLLLRIATIVLAAVLLARPMLQNFTQPPAAVEPAAVVLVFDTSGSMDYHAKGQSLLVRAKQQAERIVASLPEQSRFAVLATDQPDGSVGFQGARDRVVGQINAVGGTPGRIALAPALDAAGEMLAKISDLKRKEVYLFTDMTADAWRDGAGVNASRDQAVSYTIVNLGGEDFNASLGDLKLNAFSLPQGADLSIETNARRPTQGAELFARVELPDRIGQPMAINVAPGAQSPLRLAVRTDATGIVQGKIVLTGLEGGDALAMDNERYFTVRVGAAAPLLLMVSDPTAARQEDPTSFVMNLAVAPPGAEVAGSQWVRREPLTADRLDAGALHGAEIVVLADVASLAKTQWSALKDFVSGGGRLWIVAGPLVSPEAYGSPEAQSLMPVDLAGRQSLNDPMGWQTPLGGKAEPLLEPFAGGKNPPLSSVLCRMRFGLKSTAETARAVLRYSDGVPAIIQRDVGEGSVVFWNFSPAREFSNLAGLKQFSVLTQRTLRLMLSQEQATMYSWGDAVTVQIPRWIKRPAAFIRRPGEDFRQVKDLNLAGVVVTIPHADRLGHWMVRITDQQGGEFEHGFSVNAPYAESVLAPADETQVKKDFPDGRVAIVPDADSAVRAAAEGSRDMDFATPVLLALLVVLTVESFFANRFYRRPVPASSGAKQKAPIS